MQKVVLVLLSLLACSSAFAPTQTRMLSSSRLFMGEDIKISAKMVSELRQKTDSPMMECKKALIESNGDMAAAEELLRVKLGKLWGDTCLPLHSSIQL